MILIIKNIVLDMSWFVQQKIEDNTYNNKDFDAILKIKEKKI